MSERDILLSAIVGSEGPIKILAVVGGTALGAMFTGWFVQVLVKLSFAQQVPRWPLWITRTLGGGLSGYLVFLWLFGGGGSGLGGSGGFGGGSGNGGTDINGKIVSSSKDGKNEAKTERKEKSKEKRPEPLPSEILRVEVLGDAPLKKIANGQTFDPAKRYRVKGELLTLREVKDQVLAGIKGKPPLRRLVIVIYQDSPDRNLSCVTDLDAWARDMDPQIGKVEVDFNEPERSAPD